jgi:hypothetical protein
MMIMVDVFGVDVYIGFIAGGIGMLCIVALLVATHIDNKREGK